MSTIETFAEGSNGNVAPVRSFSVSGFIFELAVDATTGNIYVGHDGFDNNLRNTHYVDTYSPTGSRVGEITPSRFTGPYGYLIAALATDVPDDLIIGGDKTAQDGDPVCAIDVFAANATSDLFDDTPPAYIIGLNKIAVPHSPNCSSTAYARFVDHILPLADLITAARRLSSSCKITPRATS